MNETANPLRPIRLLLLVVLVGPGCGERTQPEPAYDASRPRRVFEPPSGEVRALPPHAIQAERIGPYIVGMPLKDTLDLLPHGPRVVLVEIDGVIDYSLVRAESGSLIIGVQPPFGVSFLTVLDPEIARTEAQVGVGSTESELRRAMGKELAWPGLAMDPRLVGFELLPDVRFAFDRPPDAPPTDNNRAEDQERRVVAVVVMRGGDRR
ncbi:MAG: hypothetical protein MJE77_47900, partial [Proteobacteria bacterium]|nr:hypothetical protein [Pseudomonadota bacterium]